MRRGMMSRKSRSGISSVGTMEYARAVQAVKSSRPNRQQFAYAFILRNAKVGWTPELRKAFFAWFPRTHDWKGGNSFTKFIDNIRTEALANIVTRARSELRSIRHQSKSLRRLLLTSSCRRGLALHTL